MRGRTPPLCTLRLVNRVKDKTVRTEGVILVARDGDGEVSVTQTGDHLGRKGMSWGAGVGLVVAVVEDDDRPWQSVR